MFPIVGVGTEVQQLFDESERAVVDGVLQRDLGQVEWPGRGLIGELRRMAEQVEKSRQVTVDVGLVNREVGPGIHQIIIGQAVPVSRLLSTYRLRMEIPVLGANEVRVLGCLIEKEQTTPDYYPLTLNALRSACNQNSNREPVMDLTESEVLAALDELRRIGLVTTTRVAGGRSVKYRHKLAETLDLSRDELAALAVLLLRGDQTVGEIRTRTERYVTFIDLDATKRTLDALADQDLAMVLERRPGEREPRWRHLFGQQTEPTEPTGPAPGVKRSLAVSDLAEPDAYKLMTGLVVPRPIGWIGTTSVDGVHNLAPYSFFNAVAARPPTVIVAPGLHEGDFKDTLRNLIDNGEFTVNVVSAELAEHMNATSTTEKGDEFARAGLTAVPGHDVKAPLVAECKANFECRVTDRVEIGRPTTTAVVVFGEIVRFHVDEAIIDDGYRVDSRRLRPVGRLAGPNYSNVTDVYQMIRPP